MSGFECMLQQRPSPCSWLTVAEVDHTAVVSFCAAGNICHMHLTAPCECFNKQSSIWARQSIGAYGTQAVQNVEIERKLAGEQQLQQKQARKAELRDAHLKQIKRKALNETTKVHEVLFINKLQKEDKELTLMQRMQVYLPLPFPLPPLPSPLQTHARVQKALETAKQGSAGTLSRSSQCMWCHKRIRVSADFMQILISLLM